MRDNEGPHIDWIGALDWFQGSRGPLMGGCHHWQESKPVRIPHKPVRQAADMRDFDPFLSSYLLLMTFAQSHFLIVIHTSMTTNTKKRDGRKAFFA